MFIKDKVYGNEEIKEPVIYQLINSPTLQRLKGISQQGMPREYFHRQVYSRFDHSLGVMILLRRLGADLTEQVAGLLHDVSHTAFSHVADWVLGDPLKEDYQDTIFLEFLKKSEIPSFFKKHNLNVNDISNLKSFTLLENEIPHLCADRIDYSLRELVDLGHRDKVKKWLADLINARGQIAFKTQEFAESFGRSFAQLQREHWAGNETKARYHILAEVLKIALDKKHITIEDFHHKTDNEILNILKNTDNDKIVDGLNRLRNGFVIKEAEEHNLYRLKKKFRYVDPEVYIGGKIMNLSSISGAYKKLIEEEKEHSKRTIRTEII